jgi:hypothetical protein
MKHCWFVWILIGACAGDPAAPKGAGSEPVTGGDTGTPETNLSPSVTAAFTPAAVTAGESSQLDVWIANFVVVDPTSSPAPEAAPGEGHYHLYLDGEFFLAAWTPFVTIDTAPDDALGDYVFRIALVDSEHNEVVPTVETEATLTIE